MAVRVLLFDMDGVLVDVSGSYRRAVEETAAQFLGRPVTAGAVQRYKNRGGFNDDWRLTEALIRDGGGTAPFEAIVAAFDRRYRGERWDGYIADERPLIDAVTLADLSRRFEALGVVTGRPREEADFAIDRFGWRDVFRVVVPVEDQPRPKPDPSPLRVALARVARSLSASLRPGDAAYVGDAVDDMRSARAAFVRAIGFIPPYLADLGLEERLRTAGAERVVRDHGVLASTLDGL